MQQYFIARSGILDIYNYQILSLNQHSSICKTKCHDKENKNLHRCWFNISTSKCIYIIDSISTFEWFVVRYIYVGLEKLPQHRLFVSIRLKIKHRRVKFWSPVKFSIIVKYPNVDWNHQSKSPEIKSKLLKFKCQSVEYQSVQNIPKYKLNYSQISRQTADNKCKMFWWWGQEKYNRISGCDLGDFHERPVACGDPNSLTAERRPLYRVFL